MNDSEISDTELLALVQQDGTQIEYINKERLTPELCLAAVKQNGQGASPDARILLFIILIKKIKH